MPTILEKEIALTNKNLFEQHCLKTLHKAFKYIVFLNSNHPEKENYLAFSNSKKNINTLNKFGFISYDYKNKLTDFKENNPKKSRISFPEYFFFKPSLLITTNKKKAKISYEASSLKENKLNELIAYETGEYSPLKKHKLNIEFKQSKKLYINSIKKILNAIKKGLVYEVNYCQELYSSDAIIDPIATYIKLNNYSPAPHSCFVKYKNSFAISSSPERFLKKTKDVIISQPIKGTIKRGENKKEDTKLIQQLANNPKEQAENIMIVDLVRNDLSRCCIAGSVKVPEFCAIHSFAHVHQMISTIEGKLKPTATVASVLESTFPMGSMTGAPKISAVNIIEQLEPFKRGLYSGSVGYISDQGDFDFNVMIRSIFYDETAKQLSIMAGSAITSKSNPEKEYEECLLKAKALIAILQKND